MYIHRDKSYYIICIIFTILYHIIYIYIHHIILIILYLYTYYIYIVVGNCGNQIFGWFQYECNQFETWWMEAKWMIDWICVPVAPTGGNWCHCQTSPNRHHRDVQWWWPLVYIYIHTYIIYNYSYNYITITIVIITIIMFIQVYIYIICFQRFLNDSANSTRFGRTSPMRQVRQVPSVRGLGELVGVKSIQTKSRWWFPEIGGVPPVIMHL